jgi:hypothetical protein
VFEVTSPRGQRAATSSQVGPTGVNAVSRIKGKVFSDLTLGEAVEGRVVSSSKQYRDFAYECLGWARTARSEQERNIFLQMAQTWLEAAALAEHREGVQSVPGIEAKETSGSDNSPGPISPRS